MPTRDFRTGKEKRYFQKTLEPGGVPDKEKRGKKADLAYVVRRRQTSRLHFDLRLEEGSVLKSQSPGDHNRLFFKLKKGPA